MTLTIGFQNCTGGFKSANGSSGMPSPASVSALLVAGNLTCISGYSLDSGNCYAPQICAVANGTGSQTFANGAYGACTAVRCDAGFSLVSGACTQTTQYALSISVETYGAKADGSADSTAAIQNAINAAVQSGVAAQVVLAAGTYRLDCTSNPPPPQQQAGYCLTISGASNVTLRGQGEGLTQLVIGNPTMGLLEITASTNITIAGLALDYSTLPFSQGSITNVTNVYNSITNQYQYSFNVTLDSGYSALDSVNPAFFSASSFAMIFDPILPQLKANVDDAVWISSMVKNANSSWNITLTSTAQENIATGDRFVLPVRGPSAGILAQVSAGISVSDITLYTASGMAFVGYANSGSVAINGLEVRRKPGTNRLLSTPADAIHLYDNTAKLSIRNCFIEGMADDAINTHSSGFIVLATDGSSWVQFPTNGNTGFTIGQTIQIVNPNTQAPRGTAKIVALSVTDGLATIYLDKPILGITNNPKYDVIFNEEFSGTNALLTHPLIFSAEFYRLNNSNLAGWSDQDLANHWVNHGIQEGRRASVFFEPGEYLKIYPDLLSAYGSTGYLNAVLHYVSDGAIAEQRIGSYAGNSLVFDSTLYRALNSDLAAMDDAQLGMHWLYHGVSEGRRANLSFNAKEYLELYPDLNSAYGSTGYFSAIQHYVTHGFPVEHRQGSIFTNPLVYDVAAYRALQSDLVPFDDLQLGIHWLMHGIDEGRKGNYDFYSQTYLNKYPNIATQIGATNYRGAILDFVTIGYAAGRSGQ